mgnify:CR=1 FL=1
MERGYGEVPSWAVREGGRERTRSFEEVGRDLLRGEREKNVFFSVPRRTNPNKHLLGGLDFFGLVEFKLTQTNSNTWIQTVTQTNPPVWIFLG